MWKLCSTVCGPKQGENYSVHMSIHVPLVYFPSTVGKLTGWWNVTEHINKSPLDSSLKSKATTLNLSRRSFTLISCFLSLSLFITPPLIFIPTLTYLLFDFFSAILSSFTLSFFLLWEAKKEMNKIEQTVRPWGRKQLADAPILSSISWESHRVLIG